MHLVGVYSFLKTLALRKRDWVAIKGRGGSVCAPGAHRKRGGHLFFDHSPPVPVFAPTSPNNLEYLLTVSKNLAHPLHPVYDDGKGGGWKWWE